MILLLILTVLVCTFVLTYTISIYAGDILREMKIRNELLGRLHHYRINKGKIREFKSWE